MRPRETKASSASTITSTAADGKSSFSSATSQTRSFSSPARSAFPVTPQSEFFTQCQSKSLHGIEVLLYCRFAKLEATKPVTPSQK